MSLSYLSDRDPGLVVQPNDRRVNAASGRVEITRTFKCRTTYVDRARRQLVPGSKMDGNPGLTLEDAPEEQEEIGYVVFVCRYVGKNPEESARKQDPLRYKTTNYTVMTVWEEFVLYTVRVGYPTFSWQYVQQKNESPRKVELKFNAADYVLQLLGKETPLIQGSQDVRNDKIYVIAQQTGNDETEYVDVIDKRISFSFVPFARKVDETVPSGANLLIGGAYAELWSRTAGSR